MSYIDEIDFSEADVDVDEDGKLFIIENDVKEEVIEINKTDSHPEVWREADMEADLIDEDERWEADDS